MSVSDCLACSGCVTSTENEMLERHGAAVLEEMLHSEANAAITWEHLNLTRLAKVFQ